MELRQLRYFVRIVELGSMGRAAQEMGMVTSALSQQITRLESELATQLLQRTSTGVMPTEAGIAFWRQAQLVLRHADDAIQAAQQARLSGQVSIGLAPTTASILALPFLDAMRSTYPDVRLHLVENLSGYLASMLQARQLDLAVVFQENDELAESAQLLLREQLVLICPRGMIRQRGKQALSFERLADVPLVLPSKKHGLRALVDQGFNRAGLRPTLVAQIAGRARLLDMDAAGRAATIQPGAALGRLGRDTFAVYPIDDDALQRPNYVVTLPESELSPVALAARTVLYDVARSLVRAQQWPGATLHEN